MPVAKCNCRLTVQCGVETMQTLWVRIYNKPTFFTVPTSMGNAGDPAVYITTVVGIG